MLAPEPTYAEVVANLAAGRIPWSTSLLKKYLMIVYAGGGGGGAIPDGSITSAKFAAGAISPIVGTTKISGLGVSDDGVFTFDSKGRITAVQEAAA